MVRPPATSGLWTFTNARGKRSCWRLGSESADQFAAKHGGLAETGSVLFNNPRLRIFFPYSEGYAVRRITVTKPVTLIKVLREVDATAVQTVAKHLLDNEGVRVVTEADADAVLRGASICDLRMQRIGGGNQVHVVMRKAASKSSQSTVSKTSQSRFWRSQSRGASPGAPASVGTATANIPSSTTQKASSTKQKKTIGKPNKTKKTKKTKKTTAKIVRRKVPVKLKLRKRKLRY